MKDLPSRVLAILPLLTVLAVGVDCRVQAVLPLATSEQNTPPRTETLDPTLPPTTGKMSKPDAPGNIHDTSSLVKVKNTNLGKLSGIVFHPQRKTLFGVSDKGHVIEFEPDGTLVKQERVRKGADFEGITSNPVTGLLYIAVEGDEVILELNPDNLQVLRDIPIDRTFEGRVLLDPKGNGVEGITFVPTSASAVGGTFFLVNQSKKLGGKDPSIVFDVEISGSESEPKAEILRYFALGTTDLSGIHYDPSGGQLLVISDDNDQMMRVNLAGRILQVVPLPRGKQEGIAVDRDGFLYIAQDSKASLLKSSQN